MSAPPIPSMWDGESFIPLPRFTKLADRHYVVGEVYPLAVQEARSAASHSHFFASLTEAWRNLPEDQAERFPSAEHLRKWALVRAGYSNSTTAVLESAAEARRFISLAKSLDEFCVVTVRDKVATVYTAKSQSMRAMGAKEFQASKSAVLDIAWQLCGVAPGEHRANAVKAA